MHKRALLVMAALVAATAITFAGISLLRGMNPGSSEHGGTASGPSTEKDDDFGTVAVYTVDDGGGLDPAATGLTAHVWQVFKRVVTPEFAASVMSQYRTGDAPKSDTLAYVYQADDPKYWILAANLATSKDDADLIATLVHEYAHILTLDGEQLHSHVAQCPTLGLSEGCADDTSYLWSFQQRFWAAYEGAPDNENSDADVAYSFYLAHEDDFVSDYAATNVVEDIAESFMTFVLEDEPTGDSVVARKLGFFWQYPELVTIRERIRDEFRADLGLAG
ncbi:hypothetical protein BH11ACT4_BH11ACT4_25980 [soil metagenome]